MAKKKQSVKWGPMLYLIGLILVAAVGVFAALGGTGLETWVYYLLFFLGLAVGYLNIQEDEIQHFLLAGIALAFGAQFFTVPLQMMNIPGTEILVNMFYALGWFVNPAVMVVAIKVVLDVMRD